MILSNLFKNFKRSLFGNEIENENEKVTVQSQELSESTKDTFQYGEYYLIYHNFCNLFIKIASDHQSLSVSNMARTTLNSKNLNYL